MLLFQFGSKFGGPDITVIQGALQQSQTAGTQQPTGTPTGPPPFSTLTFGNQTLNLPMQPSGHLTGQQIGLGQGKPQPFSSQTQVSPVPSTVSMNCGVSLYQTT